MLNENISLFKYTSSKENTKNFFKVFRLIPNFPHHFNSSSVKSLTLTLIIDPSVFSNFELVYSFIQDLLTGKLIFFLIPKSLAIIANALE